MKGLTLGIILATFLAMSFGGCAPPETVTAPPQSPQPEATPSTPTGQVTIGNFTVKVENAELVSALDKYAPERSGGAFLLIYVSVSNEDKTRRLFGGPGTEYFGVAPEEQMGVVLIDARGYEFQAFGKVPLMESKMEWTCLPQMIEPLTQRKLTIPFDIPGDDTGLQLVLRDFISKKEYRVAVTVR